IQFQHHVVAIRTTTVTSQDFLDHGTGNHVTTGKVLGVGRVTRHEALAMLVDQVTTFTTAASATHYTGAGDTCRAELPHFHVLLRNTGTQGHADTITGVDQGVGGRGVDTTGTASGQHGGLGTDVYGFTGFDADGNDTYHRAILVLHQIHGIPFIKEG